MICFEYDKKLNKFRCYDDRFDFIALSGYGVNTREAEIAFFNISINLKNPQSIINMGCMT